MGVVLGADTAGLGRLQTWVTVMWRSAQGGHVREMSVTDSPHTMGIPAPPATSYHSLQSVLLVFCQLTTTSVGMFSCKNKQSSAYQAGGMVREKIPSLWPREWYYFGIILEI